MTTEQPEALRLADEFDADEWIAHTSQWRSEAVAELRRLHKENERLKKVGEQALEALEDVGVLTDREWQAVHKNKPADLRQAIADMEKQEPVALETIYETIIHWDEGGGKRSRRELARRIVDLYAHSAQPKAEQEPVAWVHTDELEELLHCNGMSVWAENALVHTEDSITKQLVPSGYLPLYTHPQPKREPLTFEQVEDCFPEGAIFAEQDGWLRVSAQTLHDIARNIEAAHGITQQGEQT